MVENSEQNKDYGEVFEPEDNFNAGEHNFSHQSLVMIGLKRCMDLGSQELREGWWDEKLDKNGNVTRKYNPDTRKAFIESVKSLKMVTEYDFDVEAKDQIKDLLIYIKDRKKFWITQEWLWWTNLNLPQRNEMSRQGKSVVQGCFNSKLEFDNYYQDEETECYRRICTEINNLAGRKDWYGTEDYEN